MGPIREWQNVSAWRLWDFLSRRDLPALLQHALEPSLLFTQLSIERARGRHQPCRIRARGRRHANLSGPCPTRPELWSGRPGDRDDIRVGSIESEYCGAHEHNLSRWATRPFCEELFSRRATRNPP